MCLNEKIRSVKTMKMSRARTVRRRSKSKTRQEGYFVSLRRMRQARNRTFEWLSSDGVLSPDEECSCYCMRQWAEQEACDHGKKPSKCCTKACLDKFARYRFCRHVVVVCRFCRMPILGEECRCFDEMFEEEDGKMSSRDAMEIESSLHVDER